MKDRLRQWKIRNCQFECPQRPLKKINQATLTQNFICLNFSLICDYVIHITLRERFLYHNDNSFVKQKSFIKNISSFLCNPDIFYFAKPINISIHKPDSLLSLILKLLSSFFFNIQSISENSNLRDLQSFFFYLEQTALR